jgi:mono/diheme cytochrome c family protein
VRRFRWLVAGETSLGLLVLLAAAVLTSLPPARLAPVAASIAAVGRADDLRLTLEVTPGRVGVNTFAVTVTSNGAPVEGAKEVELQFSPETSGLPPMIATLSENGDGRYSVDGAFLTLPDKWQVQVAVRRQSQFDAITDLTLDLRPGGLSQELPWSRYAGIFLAAAAVLATAALWYAGGDSHLERGFAVAAGLILLAAGTSVALRPMPARNLVNPVPPDQASVASGQALYLAHCVPCHGARGKGDGPIGLTLSPRPADLTIHTIPGVHPDGQLYDWITNGYPGSVMPAWKDRLSDTLRWNLVNYLRTLAPTATP